jgi:hypothetical protein
MTKLWERTLRDEEFTTGICVQANELEKLRFQGGHVPAERVPALSILLTSSYQPADYFPIGLLFFISEKVRRALEDHKAEVEYFSVTLIYRDKPYTEQNYYLLNFLNSVECIDRRRSTAEFSLEGDLIDMQTLVIDESCVQGLNIFYIRKLAVVGVSDQLAEAILRVSPTGVRLIEVKEYEF